MPELNTPILSSIKNDAHKRKLFLFFYRTVNILLVQEHDGVINLPMADRTQPEGLCNGPVSVRLSVSTS